MDTISIINDVNQNILMENILIINQQKLLDLVINNFEENFKEYDSEKITYEHVSDYFNNQNFINWELFIRLMNIETTIKYKRRDNKVADIKSLIYILYEIERKNYSTKLIEFLLKIPNIIKWNIKSKFTNSYALCLLLCYSKYNNENINKIIIESDIFDSIEWKALNDDNKCSIYYYIFNQSESNIIKALENKKINIDDIVYTNKNTNKNKKAISLIIGRELTNVLKYILDCNIINNEILQSSDLLYDICIRSNFNMIKMLTEKGIDFNLIPSNSQIINKPVNYIKSQEIILYLIEKEKIILDNTMFNYCIKNDWYKVLEYYFQNDLIECEQLYKLHTLVNLIYNKHYKYTCHISSLLLKYFTENLKYNLVYEDKNEENNNFENKEK